MPNHKSCKKRLRQDEKKAVSNGIVKSTIKTLTKKFRSELPLEEKQEILITLSSKLDKAAKRHIIHKKNASRKKSRLALHLNKEKASATQ